MNNILEVTNLNIDRISRKHIKHNIVHNLSFGIPAGKIVGIVGESGSGKSISMKSLLGLLPEALSATCDYLAINNQLYDITDQRSLQNSPISMIFQDPMSSLNPLHSIEFHLIEVIQRYQNISRREAAKIAIQKLESVRINKPELVMKAYPHELSGGMIQRIMIAMALLKDSVLLIADEPTTALDVTVQAHILSLLREVNREESISIIIVTHDFGVIAEMCDYIYVMFDGVIVEAGSTEDIFYRPQHEYTQELLKAIPTGKREEKLYVMDPYSIEEEVRLGGKLVQHDKQHFVFRKE